MFLKSVFSWHLRINMEIFVSTIEYEIVVIVFILPLFLLNFSLNLFHSFIYLRWRLPKRRTHAYYILKILVVGINLVLNVVSYMAPDGMRYYGKLLLF
jgi:hypothetical protein